MLLRLLPISLDDHTLIVDELRPLHDASRQVPGLVLHVVRDEFPRGSRFREDDSVHFVCSQELVDVPVKALNRNGMFPPSPREEDLSRSRCQPELAWLLWRVSVEEFLRDLHRGVGTAVRQGDVERYVPFKVGAASPFENVFLSRYLAVMRHFAPVSEEEEV